MILLLHCVSDREQSGEGGDHSDRQPVTRSVEKKSSSCSLHPTPVLTIAVVDRRGETRDRQDGGWRQQAHPQIKGHGGKASSQSLPQEHVRSY